ncbi:MAG: flagellar hook protein FlgE, partial [Pseudomonas formosensis]|nr:flagellar hook protein FlgE [Halopseudomonas formosensis]
MSFNIGLSGIRAASSDLNITGNNIANASTVGFKAARAEFGDVYAASILGTGSNAQGSGVVLNNVAQLFTQGNINYTDNSLDLAINGNGFFVTSNKGALSYTRAGYFGTDREGFIVNNQGERLQGYGVDALSGEIERGNRVDLRVDTSAGVPNQTSEVKLTLNLNSSQLPPTNPAFDPADSSTYNDSTSVTVYDSLGNSHVLTKYFVKTSAADNAWNMHLYIDGADVLGGTPATLTFNENGVLTGGMVTSIPNWQPLDAAGADNGAEVQSLSLNLTGSSQYAASFGVTSLVQDGYTTGELAGLEIDDRGMLIARYTNGQTKVQGQVMLANFANQQGLTPLGNTAWAQSSA